MQLGGGVRRQIVKDVAEADWSKDGSQLLVARVERGKEILEYPIGKEIYETDGWIGNPHISPDGKQIAFVQHPIISDDMGVITVTDLSGKTKTLTKMWTSARGMSWSPVGGAICITATDKEASGWLHA